MARQTNIIIFLYSVMKFKEFGYRKKSVIKIHTNINKTNLTPNTLLVTFDLHLWHYKFNITRFVGNK